MLRIILINYDKISNQSIQLYNYGSDILKCILSFMISCENLNSLWLKFLYSLKSKK